MVPKFCSELFLNGREGLEGDLQLPAQRQGGGGTDFPHLVFLNEMNEKDSN